MLQDINFVRRKAMGLIVIILVLKSFVENSGMIPEVNKIRISVGLFLVVSAITDNVFILEGNVEVNSLKQTNFIILVLLFTDRNVNRLLSREVRYLIFIVLMLQDEDIRDVHRQLFFDDYVIVSFTNIVVRDYVTDRIKDNYITRTDSLVRFNIVYLEREQSNISLVLDLIIVFILRELGRKVLQLDSAFDYRVLLGKKGR